MPQYLSAPQSAGLDEATILFCGEYHENGSHAGFVSYMTDAAAHTQDVDNLRQAMRDSVVPGDFRHRFMYAANGKKDGIQILPVHEVAARDEFFNIKGATCEDQLARAPRAAVADGHPAEQCWRVRAVELAACVFADNELVPLQWQFMAINEWTGVEVVRAPLSQNCDTAEGARGLAWRGEEVTCDVTHVDAAFRPVEFLRDMPSHLWPGCNVTQFPRNVE